jgi:PAS domain S-box-containing protein
VPIPVFLVLLFVLAALDVGTVFEPPWLLPTLNTLFLSILPLAVVYVATSGYIQSGLITLLMLGTGTLTLGLGATVAGLTISWPGGGPNANVTVYNVSALLSAMFYLLGVALVLTGVHPRKETRHGKINVILTYIGVAVLITLLTIATLMGLTPVFFVQGEGPTDFRQAVLGAAMVLFVVSGSLLAVQYYLTRWKFLYWHSLAMLLIATGSVCVLFQESVGSPIGWLGRGGMYLAGVYLLISAINASRELRSTGREMEKGIADLFRHRLEFMVEERTSQLRLANEQLSTEIVERKHAEDALRESEEMLMAILSTSPIGIALTKERRIEWANDAWSQMFGFENEQDYLGQSARMLYPSDEEYERAGKMLYGGLEIGKVGDTDVKFKRKDGSLFDANVKIRLLDPLDPAKGAISSVSDISFRKRAEEVQRRLATAIEQSVELVIITDASRNIQYVNPAFERISGYTREEVIGKNPKLLGSDEHDKAFYKKMLDTIRGGEAWRGRIISQRKDGTLFSEDVTISPVRDGVGNIINYVDVGHDVSQEVALQSQLSQAQKMEAIGTLAGGVAHDFNNLLTVIMGFSELLLTEKDEQDPSYADLQKINEAAQKGADLVKRLLAFSRKAEIKLRPLNLNYQIEQLQEMLNRVIPKMIAIELNLADGLSRVNADPTQMDQVLMNLAVNAKDAMPERGKLAIETSNVVLDEEYARTHLGVKPGAYVLLSLSDTGHGMDKETLSHIFEPFYTTKEAGKGTGLGLAMVYGIVKQHGGYITCYSEPGQGTTFKIYLPVLAGTGDQLETAAREATPRGGTETVLLVDDEEFVRDLGKQILERSGYAVLTADNGKEALSIYSKERDKISLVILDLIMPEMGGKQCLEELLKIDPQIRVLIASGFAENGRTKEAIETGARGFVGKPYNMKGMLQAVREVLDAE